MSLLILLSVLFARSLRFPWAPPPAIKEVIECPQLPSSGFYQAAVAEVVDRLVIGSRPLSVGERMNADIQGWQQMAALHFATRG